MAAAKAVKYLEMMVDPTIAEFSERPSDRRRAFLACVALYHTVDYVTRPKSSPGNLARNLASECADFALVDRVARAFKHVSTAACRGLLEGH